MNGLVLFFNQITPILQSILILAALVGGIFVVRNTKRNGIVQIQSDTIETMQHQIDALKDQNIQQQEKIDEQQGKIDGLEEDMKTMREALEDEGIFITVDGKKVTIKDVREPDATRHIIRKPTKKPTAGSQKTGEGT